jgi:hypothetical protein
VRSLGVFDLLELASSCADVAKRLHERSSKLLRRRTTRFSGTGGEHQAALCYIK